jgi:hypothetical protein
MYAALSNISLQGAIIPPVDEKFSVYGKEGWSLTGKPLAAGTIPLALEPRCPVGKMMYLVQQQNCCSVLRKPLRVCPISLPESWKRRIRLIADCVDSSVPELRGDFQKQRSLAHLARPGEKLNAPRRCFFQPIEQHFPAKGIGVLQISQTLIIIRLWWGLGLIAVMLHACVDYPFPRPAVSGWLFAMLALLYIARSSDRLRQGPEETQSSNDSPRVVEFKR